MSNVVLSANYMEASTLDSLDESTSSSDAGDVLIRATRIPFLNQSSFDKRNFGTISVEPGCNDRVTISVKRLREVTLPSMEATTETVLEQEQTYVPPALPANKPLAAPLEMLNATSSDKAKVQRGDPKVKNGPGEDSVSQASNTDGKQPLSHSSLPGGSMLKGQDVLISQYAGNKEAVRAVLKQRSNSAPLRREVKVQLLNRPSSATQAPQGPQGPPHLLGPQPPALFPGDQGAGAAAAAVTAAALTVTAPLLKAQSELDSQLARFSADLQRLQAVRPQEDRSSVLEQQLHSLTQQRLQHLERIQEQQMELQNRLLGSALGVVTARVPGPAPQASAAPALQLAPGPREQSVTPPGPLAPTTAGAGAGDRAQRGRGRRTPPETPAPRRFAPMPMSRDARARNGQEHFAPDPRKASRPAGGNGRLLEEILNNPKSSGSRTKPAGGQRVAIATAVCQPEPSRAPGQASTAVRKPSSEHPGLGRVLGELPSVPSSAMERASGMLQDLGRLKQEMQTLLQEGRQSPPPGLQTHGKTGSVFFGRVLPGDALGDEGREPAALPPPPPPPPPPHVSTGEERVHGNLPQAAPQPPPALLQKSRPPPSMFEDAGKALRRVQRHKRLLEDNLEAILRAKDGEALHCQLEALCSNRGAKEAVRIRKTVDAWISTLSKDIQAEMGREDSAARTAERDKGSRGGSPLKGGGAKDLGPLKEGTGAAGSRARPAGRKPFQRGAQGHAPEAQHKHLAPSLKTRGPHQPRLFGASKSEKEDEEYLMKVYGKALYDGHRRTLKKAPYLRFSSPSPKAKPQRPRVVESVRGVKVKSAKTQTSLFPDKTRTIDTEPQYIFSPTRGGHDGPGAPHTALEGLLIPMAIPLGQPRVDGGAPQPSRVIITRRPVTTTASIPPAPPKQASKPNVVVMEVQSERKPKPQLRVQVLPRVDIDSVSSASPAPSSPLPPPPRIQTVEQIPEEDLTVFPGTDYLAVADISQEPEEEFVDTPIELSGSAEPPAAMYHGPAYPPRPSGPPPGTEPILGVIQQRETLENRLVDWVEQQLMARAIAGMCPQRAPVERASLSEPEESGSDIVEAAGGGGLQYFVDAGVPVDSALIRQYVTDALAETVALMLGQREGQGRPTTPPQPLDVPCTAEVVVPTPVPTPVPSPRESPLPPAKEPSPHSTPEPSEQGSTTESPRDLLPPEDRDTGPAGAERSPVATPTITPVSSPPRVATPPALPTPQSMEPARHLNPWGDAELPLEEEVPHYDIEDSLQYHRPVLMSVAKEEEPVSLVSVSPPLLPKQPSPPRHSPTPPLLPETPPPASSPSSADSSSSPSVTETDAAGRHISEGELLLSSGPMAATRVMAEEGLTLPAFNTSLSSSLHGVLDIDYDPPSEGQVVRRPRVPHHRDPFLSLLAKMDQGPMLLQEVSHHPEGCWDEDSSAGELSEGQRPRLTAVGESLLTGRSLLDQATLSRPGPGPSPGQGGHLSPGQLSLPAGMALGSVQASENPVTLMDLAASPHTEPGARDSEEQASDCIVPARRPAPILVRQYQERPGGTEETDSSFNSGPLSTNANAFFQGEDRDVPFVSTSSGQHSPTTVLVMLPSAEQDRASASVSAVETDSSENDVF